MTRKLKTYLVLLIIPFLLSSCASILNSKFQKVTIKTDEKSSVLVDGRVPERTKDGRYLIRRDAESKQITVKKEGCKDLNTSIIQYKKSPYYAMSIVPFSVAFFIPVMCDNMIKSRNYVKEVSLDNKMIELPNKERISSVIRLNKTFAQLNDESNFSRVTIPYRKFINENQSAKKKDKEVINLTSTLFSSLLEKLLKEENYMISKKNIFEELVSNPILNKQEQNSLDKIYINATLNKYRYHSFYSRAAGNGGTISNYGNMLYVEMGIKWKIMDNDKNVLFTHQ
jgi:hypothetical protein